MNDASMNDASINDTAQVVVSVGTDKHPFDRLIGWIDAWAKEHPDVPVFVQYGNSSAPQHATGAALIPHPELLDVIATATVVISHGGPSTVMDVRSKGLRPIVIGRDPQFGEHVDEHQMRFAEHLQRHDRAQLATGRDHLHELIDSGLADPDSQRFTIGEQEVPSGVAAFAEHMNALLNISNPPRKTS